MECVGHRRPIQDLGSPDIVVNNAGGNFFCPSSELSPNGFGAGGPGIESAVSGLPILAD